MLIAAQLSVASPVQVDNDEVNNVDWRQRQLYDDYVTLRDQLIAARLRHALHHDHAKRRPMFVGKRAADGGASEYRYWGIEKRRAPMFVGKRPNPFFVG